MAPGAGDSWSVPLGSLGAGVTVDYTLTASDPFGNLSNVTGSFQTLYQCDVTFNVKDFITQELLDGVALDVSARHITDQETGLDYWIPAETHSFDQTINLTQYEGTYTYTFAVPGFDNKVISRTLVGGPDCGLTEDVLMGQPVEVSILSVELVEAPQCSGDEGHFYLHVIADIASTYDLQTAKFYYSFDVEDYGYDFDLVQQEPGVYVGSLGPLTGGFILYSKVYVEDITSSSDTEVLMPRWYYLLPCVIEGPSQCLEVEICNNYIDDDCDGSIDEGCGCDFGAQKICGSSVGICQSGFQYCQDDGTWGECEGAIGPLAAEICGNGLDDDCDSMVDNGCLLVEEFGLPCLRGEIFIDMEAAVGLGQVQEMLIRHPDLGPLPNTPVEVTFPDGTVLVLKSDEEGRISFNTTLPGEHQVKVIKQNLTRTETFTVVDVVQATRQGLENVGSLINPRSGIAEQPKIVWFVWMSLLFVLSGLASLLSYRHLLDLARDVRKGRARKRQRAHGRTGKGQKGGGKRGK